MMLVTFPRNGAGDTIIQINGKGNTHMRSLAPHMIRVCEEKIELDAKLSKLVAFFDTPVFKQLSEGERFLLDIQSKTMKHYSEILGARIVYFVPELLP